MNTKFRNLSILACFIFFMSIQACKEVVDPELTTAGVSSITSTNATCGGSVDTDGNAKITARGVCVDTTITPDLGDIVTSDGTGLGNFVSQITGLKPNTKYYVRAYACNKQGTGYGTAMVFTTQP
jgi:hypothetical protein